ncbi:MAG: endonuclease/exonuclease/phosphatase family protein, partial [Flavobacteriales bacterium]|nr:endonuclease/exonuclease/phosphatase family protein [Flavobacteriales bacterium]
MKKLNLLDKVIYLINVLFVIFLGLSISSKFLPPQTILTPAFFGLAFLPLFLLNLLFLIYWIVKRKRVLFLPLAGLLLSWTTFTNSFSFGVASSKGTNTFKLTSWNVRLFDLYNWNHNLQSKKKMFDYLEKLDSDIYCFQEFYHDKRKKSNFYTLEPLKKLLATKYHFSGYKHRISKFQNVGLIILSKYKVINSQKILFKNQSKNLYIYADLDLGGDTVRIVNVHLASVKLQKDDYRFIQDLQENKSADMETGLKSLYRRLRSAFLIRETQVKELKEMMEKSPHPIIFAGDFNDTPSSYSYRMLNHDLEDT